MSRTLLLAAVVTAAALLLPAPVLAGTPFTIGKGQNPHVLVDPDGTAHVAWEDQNANTVKYCKVARGATACTSAATLSLPSGDAAPPWLVRGPGATLYVAMPRYVAGETRLWTSNDNGATWPPGTGTKIYSTPNTTDATEPLLGPTPGEMTFASWNPGRQIWGAAINGSEAGVSDSANPPNPGSIASLVYDLAIAPTGAGGLVAVANNLTNTYWWSMTAGAEPSLSTNWSSAPTEIATLDTSRVAGGATGAFLWGVAGKYDGSDPRRVEIRKWTGSGFGGATVLESGDGYIGDVHVGTAGAVGAIWRRNGDPHRLRFARSTDGGATYSVNTIALEDGLVMFGMDVALADDGNGFAVWQGKGTGVSNENEIRMANTDTVAEPATGGSGGGTGPTPTTTTPTPLPRLPVAPRPATTPLAVGRRVGARVSGATISVGLPRGCIPAGRPFVATLTWRKQRRKGNRFVKITRTDFYIGTRRMKIDRKVPFRQTLRIPNPRRGQTYRFRARAFIKVRRGRSPKKSIVSTLRVCS
jgi:hypothetical protein